MSNSAISAALATRLSGLSLPTQYENSDYTPPADTVYLAESIIPAATIAMGIANTGSDAREGIYQVLIYAPAGSTKGGAFATADSVEAHFTKGLRLTYAGVTVTILRTERETAFMSGDRFALPISIYYRAMV